MKYNPNLDREGNRVLYLVNEMLQDMSSFVPLDRKIVIIYNDRKEIEDYDYPDFDGEDVDDVDYLNFDDEEEEENDLHFAIYEGEMGEETTLKEGFFYLLSFLNPDLPHESVVLLGIRLAQGLSQLDMAKKIGISKQAYFNMETGKIKVPQNVREKVCFLCKDPLGRYNFEVSDFGI